MFRLSRDMKEVSGISPRMNGMVPVIFGKWLNGLGMVPEYFGGVIFWSSGKSQNGKILVGPACVGAHMGPTSGAAKEGGEEP